MKCKKEWYIKIYIVIALRLSISACLILEGFKTENCIRYLYILNAILKMAMVNKSTEWMA